MRLVKDLAASLSGFSGRPAYAPEGDIFVSPLGSDEASGTYERPFKTLARAQRAARELASVRGRATVCAKAGVYRETLRFDARDSFCSYRPAGDGDAVLDSSLELEDSEFAFCPGGVRVCDLKSRGVSEEDIGELRYIGAQGTEKMYDPAPLPGENVQLFMGRTRLELASYPASGFLKLKAVRDQGEPSEYPVHTWHPENVNKRNPRAGEYVMDDETNQRVRGWKHKNGLWIYGCLAYDWADSSTPVTVNTDTASIFPRCVSRFAAYPGGLYRFLNVRDELKQPGQYYIDRSELKLYYIPPEGSEGETLHLCLSERPHIEIDSARDLTIEGFTLLHGRGDAIVAKGEGIRLNDLTVCCFGGKAIDISGENNAVTGCELYRLGRGGVLMKGGAPKRLEQASSCVDNCFIHHFGEVSMHYNPGVNAVGCGISVTHNEICFSPHAAVLYSGKYIFVEYNHIHHAVRHASDAGAIYSGRDWTNVGCRVNYNFVHDIGEGGFTPDGIYFDDMLSGQECRGNIVVNVGKNGLLMGGGRDNTVTNNIFACCLNGIKFDDRARDAVVGNGWAKRLLDPGSQIWERLKAMPLNEEPWISRFPGLSRLHGDLMRVDDPDFAPNPVGCLVTNNIVIGSRENQLLIYEGSRRYSTVENNYLYASEGELKALPEGFEPIPVEKIGRY
ncbi:MAG: right-handed parallel beta-helix repeat-containing protein [Clostridiales bacterium]|nr:right-handed parallel beta-helix repeat-containing protein [Clostridiales bacterium]